MTLGHIAHGAIRSRQATPTPRPPAHARRRLGLLLAAHVAVSGAFVTVAALYLGRMVTAASHHHSGG